MPYMVFASSGKQVLKRGKEDPRAYEEAGKFGVPRANKTP
jgi:hypothetical protein